MTQEKKLKNWEKGGKKLGLSNTANTMVGSWCSPLTAVGAMMVVGSFPGSYELVSGIANHERPMVYTTVHGLQFF